MSSALVPIVKVTGYIPSKIYFRRKIYYVNKEVQNRKIRGAAIIVSNHTAVIDFGLYLFLFGGRTLANRGTSKGSLNNCYSAGFVPDSLDGIMQTARDIAMTFKAQGGQGLSLSKIRPKGSLINNTFK